MYVDVGKFGDKVKFGKFGVVGLLVCWFAGLLVCWFAGLFANPPTKTVQAYTRDPTVSDLERLDKFG